MTSHTAGIMGLLSFRRAARQNRCAIDARTLALFGERLRTELRRLPTAVERELKAMVKGRD
jgi:hypothetical protein